jgi:hypothetical protein
LFAGKRLIAVGMVPMLRCWRGIEALMAQGGARYINACHSRANRAIGNRIGRDVGDGVDDAPHRILLWRFRARSRKKEMEGFVSRKLEFHGPN